ncbi:MAG: hypothetical protein WCB63_05455 [Polyangiales bacterium]
MRSSSRATVIRTEGTDWVLELWWKAVIARSDSIEADAKGIAREAWAKPVSFED